MNVFSNFISNIINYRSSTFFLNYSLCALQYTIFFIYVVFIILQFYDLQSLDSLSISAACSVLISTTISLSLYYKRDFACVVSFELNPSATILLSNCLIGLALVDTLSSFSNFFIFCVIMHIFFSLDYDCNTSLLNNPLDYLQKSTLSKRLNCL